MVFEEGNALHMFVVPRGHTLCILVSNTERKQKRFTGNHCRANVRKQLGRPLKCIYSTICQRAIDETISV